MARAAKHEAAKNGAAKHIVVKHGQQRTELQSAEQQSQRERRKRGTYSIGNQACFSFKHETASRKEQYIERRLIKYGAVKRSKHIVWRNIQHWFTLGVDQHKV